MVGDCQQDVIWTEGRKAMLLGITDIQNPATVHLAL